MSRPGSGVGILSDITLQRHRVSEVVKALGYPVSVCQAPENIDIDALPVEQVGVWLIYLDEEAAGDWLEKLYSRTDAPVYFGDAKAPSVNSDRYNKWQRKLHEKISARIDLYPQDRAVAQEQPSAEDVNSRPVIEAHGPCPARRAPAENVWVLGSSLGGLEAVKEFLDTLPEKLPVAFVLAQHIGQDFQGVLAQVLGRHNNFIFRVPKQDLVLAHEDVLVLSTSQAIEVSAGGRISITGQPWTGAYSPSIDQVMATVSKSYGEKSGAILFSGMGDDGVVGASVAKRQGATIWAQSAESCVNSSMPDAVRAAGCVSQSNTPEQLANNLSGYLQRHAKGLGSKV